MGTVAQDNPAAAWRARVEARQAEAEAAGAGQRGYWDRRAAGFKASLEGRPEDPFLDFLEPWLSPRKTVLDVGAGWGRHALPLAARVDWVTAVEPSEGMRELMAAAPNLTVIASGWEDAVAAPADLVICCHVLYGVAEVVPFLEKLEASARERVFVYMREQPPPIPAEELWRALGAPRTPMPEFADLLNVLREMGVAPEVARLRYPSRLVYPSLEAAVDEARAALGERWEEARGRAFLEARLVPEAGGGVAWPAGEMVSGVAHWTPRTR
jgi:hypothetical protein